MSSLQYEPVSNRVGSGLVYAVIACHALVLANETAVTSLDQLLSLLYLPSRNGVARLGAYYAGGNGSIPYFEKRLSLPVTPKDEEELLACIEAPALLAQCGPRVRGLAALRATLKLREYYRKQLLAYQGNARWRF